MSVANPLNSHGAPEPYKALHRRLAALEKELGQVAALNLPSAAARELLCAEASVKYAKKLCR